MWWTVRLPLGFSADLKPICWFFPAFIWKLLGWKCLIVMLTGIWSQNVSQFGLRCCCIAPLFLCIDRWGSLFYPSLLFFGTLYSNGNIFLFLLCFLLLFFAELFVRPPQTAILLFCISFPWGWSWSLSPVQCHEPPSIVHQVLCLSDLVKDKNGMDLTEVEDIKNRWQEYTEELYKTDLTTQIITMVWSLT